MHYNLHLILYTATAHMEMHDQTIDYQIRQVVGWRLHSFMENECTIMNGPTTQYFTYYMYKAMVKTFSLVRLHIHTIH